MTMTVVVVVIEKPQETVPLYKTAKTSSTFDKRKQIHVAGICIRGGKSDFLL